MPIKAIRQFWHDNRGAVAFETVIMIPILAWVVMASFVFFDAYRTYNTSVKSTYAIADVISRQTEEFDEVYLNGLADVFTHMVRNTTNTRMRVTQIHWDEDTGAFRVDWSHATGGEARLFDASLESIEELLPTMVDAERTLLVETFVPYQPSFDMGLDLFEFSNFTFTRPRYGDLRGPDPDATANGNAHDDGDTEVDPTT